MGSTAKERTVGALLCAAKNAERDGDVTAAMMYQEQAVEAHECLVHRAHRKREWPEPEEYPDA